VSIQSLSKDTNVRTKYVSKNGNVRFLAIALFLNSLYYVNINSFSTDFQN